MHESRTPSAWITRFAHLVPPGGSVLDLACGSGRHTRFFLARGHPVSALDRDVTGLADLAGRAGLEIARADLEDGSPWPLMGRRFAAVVVINYLWRPLFPHILDALDAGGVLLYATFARGNEAYGRPACPAFLLDSGELIRLARDGGLQVVAYEHGYLAQPRPAIRQRLCAIRGDQPAPLQP